MKSKNFLRAICLLVLLFSFIPTSNAVVYAATVLPPADMFQLPWEQGLAWLAIDGFDNGFKRPLNSSHNYLNGGAVDFAPHTNMKVGEDTSNFWVTAAAAGTVVEISNCHLKINHGNGWVTEYQFLANVQVTLGEAVYRNQRLAIIADGLRQKFCPGSVDPNTPHLHFTLRPVMRGATFSGWAINYNPLFNRTTFTKNGQTLGLNQPLLNTPNLQIVLRDLITFDTIYIGSVDAYRYERWPFVLTETTNFTLTATPTTAGLIPVLVLMNADGNEITRGTGTLTSTQSAGNYFVQVQPQAGNGFYNLLLHKNDLPEPTGPFVSVVVNPTSVNEGEAANVTVNLKNVPATGYTSAEFTCTYNANIAEVSDIVPADLFGADPVAAINGPQNGSFIVAIAGSSGSKATTSGAAFTFSVTGLQAGQTEIDCKARISAGDQVLTEIPSIPTSLTILGGTPTPIFTPTLPAPIVTSTPEVSSTPTLTATPTFSTSDWLTYTNSKYGFEFKYPKEGQIAANSTDTFAHINLPRAPGTNLGDKYLEVIVAENANPCQSPLATESGLQTTETVAINGLSFLKQTGGDATAGHMNTWVAYTIQRDIVCVSLDFVLRAANPGAFATPPPLFDEPAEKAVFEQIVSTYTWLAFSTATPTFTPTSTPTEAPTTTPTATQPPAQPILTGQVIASKVVTVRLYDTDQNFVAAVNANPDGTFRFDVAAGTYTIVATANGFMRAQGSITLADGDVRALSPISLLAGDIDDNEIIDQFDALTIGMAYNTAEPPGADLNNDGIINVLDLEALAANYRAVGPTVWQP